MITKITDEHQEEVTLLHKEFEEKCQKYIDQVNFLKQNIVALQQSNQELEKDRTNERTLRLKLEEEYM